MAEQRTDRNYYAEFEGNTPEDGLQLSLGYYQYVTLDDLINNFVFAQTGEGSLLGNVNRNLVAYHMQRTIQELNYDVLRVERSLQVEINPATRSIPLPQDFVNEVQVSWLDQKGYKHPMLPGQTSSGQSPAQDYKYDYLYDDQGMLLEATPSDALTKFISDQSIADGGNGGTNASGRPDLAYFFGAGENDYELPSSGYPTRYGLNTQEANNNGRYSIDRPNGVIYFDDSITNYDGSVINPNDLTRPESGRTGILIAVDYISDGLATVFGEEPKIQVNKLVEKTVYKMTEYELLSNKIATPDYVLRRVKKEASAMMRNSKIRLMNLNLANLAQWAREQSTWIKH